MNIPPLRKILAWGLPSLTGAAVLLATHRAVPFMMDDLWYSTLLYSEAPLERLSQIPAAQLWHWQHWGGRSPAHALLQAILLQGEWAADILNLLTHAALAWLMAFLAGSGRQLQAVFCAFFGLVALNANWKMSMFWQSGAANYPYMMLIILAYICLLALLYPRPLGYGRPLARLKPGASALCRAALPPIAFLAGWSNENIGPALCLLTLYVWLTQHGPALRLPLFFSLGNARTERACSSVKKADPAAPNAPGLPSALPLALASGASLAGCLLLLTAPGNRIRSLETANGYGRLWNLFLRAYAQGRGLMDYLFPTLLLLCCLLLLYRLAVPRDITMDVCPMLALAALSFGAMALSPHYPDRASFGTMVFLLIPCLRLAGAVRAGGQGHTRLWLLLPGLLWLRTMYVCGEFLAISWGWIR